MTAASVNGVRPEGRPRCLLLAVIIGLLLISPATTSVAAAGNGTHGQGVDPLPLGTLEIVQGVVDRTCPDGFTCAGFDVTCPSLRSDARGFFAVANPTIAPVGTLMFFTGGYGNTWWTNQLTPPFTSRLLAAGLQLVQVRWVDPWLFASSGEAAGPALLACRPATAVEWVHDNLYVPAGHDPGLCGFCVTGSSGGASAVSYSMEFYGLDSITDAAFPTGGPPHAALAKGCLQEPGYAYTGWDSRIIDASYGFLGVPGPCAQQDPSFQGRWDADSVDLGGSDYVHPTTRFHFIIGQLDDTGAPYHARDYFDVLDSVGQTLSLAWEVVPGMGHEVMESRQGLAALLSTVLGG